MQGTDPPGWNLIDIGNVEFVGAIGTIRIAFIGDLPLIGVNDLNYFIQCLRR